MDDEEITHIRDLTVQVRRTDNLARALEGIAKRRHLEDNKLPLIPERRHDPRYFNNPAIWPAD